MSTNTAYRYAQKKESHRPAQSGGSSKVTQFPRGTRKKRRTIIHRIVRFVKVWRRLIALAAAVILIILSLVLIVNAVIGHHAREAEALEQVPQDIPVEAQAAAPADLFYATDRFGDGEACAINWEHLTNAWAAEAGFEKRYELTDEERLIVCQVVQAEAGGEPYAGKVAVAQCILQACEDDGIRPDVAVRKYGYSKNRPEPSQEALDAVQDVFDFGHVATTEPIKYFYAPDRTTSSWHETQIYVMTINGHRFFKEATE